MKTRIKMLATAMAAAGVMTAGGAAAATYVAPWTQSPSGAVSVVFGENGLDVPGAGSVAGQTSTTHSYDAVTRAFTDTFSFELPTGVVGFTLSSIGFTASSSLSLSTFTFNGTPIDFTNSPDGTGGISVDAKSGKLPVVLGGPQVLTVSGTGGPDAVFSGTATFASAAAVPEPASWALMILGFGGMGAMIRRRRTAMLAA